MTDRSPDPPSRPRFSQLPPAIPEGVEGVEPRRFAGHVDHAERLSHLRIAHLTDLHVGRVTPYAAQRAAVDLTNAQNPDLIVITGDFVCHSQAYLDQLEELIGLFQAPVLTVLGNHDYWSGDREVRQALRRGGAEVLDNAHTTVTLRRQRLQVVGVDDGYTGHARVKRAVKGLRDDLPVIGLSHIGEEADELWHYGVPLVFSGHTHAGQVTLARLHEFTLGRVVGHKYIHGLYGCRRNHRERGAVYVGAGIGAAVVPLRLGERGRREVAMFDLGAEAGAEWEHHDEQPPHPGRKPSARTRARRRKQLERKLRKRRERDRGKR